MKYSPHVQRNSLKLYVPTLYVSFHSFILYKYMT